MMGRRTFFETFAGTCSDEDMQLFLDSSYAPEKVQTELEQQLSHFLILEDESGALGYSRLLGLDTELVELVRFYLEQRAIGTGAAHRLMEDSLELARAMGYRRIVLGVWEKNLRAQRFYQKWGFAKCGEKVFPVGNDPQVDWWYERAL